MTASMTIRLTEDADPDGCVGIDFDIEGYDIADAETNADLPAALLLGAKMVELSRDLPDTGPADPTIIQLRLMEQDD